MIEMQNYNKDLLKRCDYYSSSMTVASLDKGEIIGEIKGRLEACKNIIELKFQWLNHLSIEQLDEVIRLSFNIMILKKLNK